MTLLRPFLRGKPQRGENRVGSGSLGFSADPILHANQSFCGLVDIVPFGDIDKGFEQLLEALLAARRVSRHGTHGTAASRRVYRSHHSFVSSHANAFPLGIPARVENHSTAG